MWNGTGVVLCWAIEHVEQYLLRTPINKSFLVCAPKITATPALALYECLWLLLLQPPSTITVHAGTSSYLMLFFIAYSSSSLPAESSSSVTKLSSAVPSDFSRCTMSEWTKMVCQGTSTAPLSEHLHLQWLPGPTLLRCYMSNGIYLQVLNFQMYAFLVTSNTWSIW